MKIMNWKYAATLFFATMILCGLLCKTAEAKPKYDRQKQTIKEDGLYTYQQKDDEMIEISFIPQETGVYYMILNDATPNTTNSTAGIYFVGNIESATQTMVEQTAYCIKGKEYTIPLAIGIPEKNHIKPQACTLEFGIKLVKNRVQKIKENKTVTFTEKDVFNKAGSVNAPTIEETAEKFASTEYVNDGYFTFQPKKTGWYRCYQVKKSAEYEVFSGINYFAEDNQLMQCLSTEVMKLKKGVIYNFKFSADVPGSTYGMQYLKTRRSIKIYSYSPSIYIPDLDEYCVLKGKKLGILVAVAPEIEVDGGKYRFIGWYTKKSGGRKITSKSKGCAKIKKLYGRWEKIS